MSVALIVMTDGRAECISRAVPSALAHLKGPITDMVIHDDSGDPDYRTWLRQMFPQFDVIGPEARQGFTGAYVNIWQFVRDLPQPYTFTTEDDFVFERDVDLMAMAGVLRMNPHVAQIALRRQAWNEQERAAGGVVEQHPGDYEDTNLWGLHVTSWGADDPRMHPVLLHRRFFTTNPSLIRTALCRRPWPNVKHSEGVFTHQLLEDPDLRFAFWGHRSDDPWVTHIGEQRNGTGY